MITVRPIKYAVFRRSGDTTSGYLLDVDVGETGFGINEFRDCEGNGGHGDGFAEEPAYALLSGRRDKHHVWDFFDRHGSERRYHLKNVISVVGEGFVLPRCQWERIYKVGKGCTMIHFPLRSFSVFSAGAAILAQTQ